MLSGLFTGLLTALLFAAGCGWALVKLLVPTPKTVVDTDKARALQATLGQTLVELEAARAQIVDKINRRMVTRLPLGLAAGVGLWILLQGNDDPPGLFELAMFTAIGGAGGWFSASQKLGAQYSRLYKDRVLPRLAADFGDLSYRDAVVPSLSLLRDQKLFRRFDDVYAEDEIFGTYRGVPLSIVEIKLSYGSGDDRQTVFDGLLTTIDLPRGLRGITAVIADNGVLGNLRDRFESDGRSRVSLEDPAFEKVYEVYGTDQIGARALLTPAFMARFLTLGERAGYMRPLALAQDHRLTIALPKAGYHSLFEPPSYSEPAKSEAHLVKLHDDIAAVLKAADAVIDLDQGARSAAVGRD